MMLKQIYQAKAGHLIYIGRHGEKEVILMSADKIKKPIKFGTATDKFKYTGNKIEGLDKDIQELFYGKG